MSKDDVVTTGYLEGSRMKAAWVDDELVIRWERDGNILGGLVLAENSVKELAALISRALQEKEKQCLQR